MRITLSGPQYGAWPAKHAYTEELLRRLQSLPGVVAAGVDVGALHTNVKVAGAAPGSGEVFASIRGVSPGYLRAMGVPLLKGTWPSAGGLSGVVVNEALRPRDGAAGGRRQACRRHNSERHNHGSGGRLQSLATGRRDPRPTSTSPTKDSPSTPRCGSWSVPPAARLQWRRRSETWFRGSIPASRSTSFRLWKMSWQIRLRRAASTCFCWPHSRGRRWCSR